MQDKNSADPIRKSLEDFLTALSQRTPGTRCPHCHSLLLATEGLFFLEGSEEGWTVRMTVCPNCEK